MKAASRLARATPSMPLGRYSLISSGMALLYSRSGLSPPEPLDRHKRHEARDDRDGGDEDLRVGADQRRALRGVQALGRERALDLGEVGRPVAEAQHEAEAEADRYPGRLERFVTLPTPCPSTSAAAARRRPSRSSPRP